MKSRNETETNVRLAADRFLSLDDIDQNTFLHAIAAKVIAENGYYSFIDLKDYKLVFVSK
jgi:hypothetical protein